MTFRGQAGHPGHAGHAGHAGHTAGVLLLLVPVLTVRHRSPDLKGIMASALSRRLRPVSMITKPFMPVMPVMPVKSVKQRALPLLFFFTGLAKWHRSLDLKGIIASVVFRGCAWSL